MGTQKCMYVVFSPLQELLCRQLINVAVFFLYVDTQIESWHYSFSTSTKIAITVLNQLWRNWFALLEETD